MPDQILDSGIREGSFVVPNHSWREERLLNGQASNVFLKR